ncbi:MAG: hypothetical protein V4538_01085 [Bacteroidota bacterium]
MGKYLQDFMSRVDLTKGLEEEQKKILDPCYLISDLYNLYLPRKVEVGNNIWRIIIKFGFDKSLDGNVSELGLCLDSYVYCDYDQLKNLNILERKQALLNLFVKGIKNCSDKYNFDISTFQKIKDKIFADNIVFYKHYKERKVSPDKKHFVQMKGFYNEDFENRKLYVDVFDKTNNLIKSILVGSYDFRKFDKLKWLDNNKIGVYHINSILSYKSKKVADDYFMVDIETNTITYNPVTKESIFQYGVKLLTQTDEYNKAINFIKQAKELGHGKADNILKNLEINPKLRDRSILLQTPKKNKNGI